MGDNDRQLRDRKVIVQTTDPKREEPNFGSAKGWHKRQLQQLGVQFVPNAKKRLDLNKVLNVDEAQWPHAVQQRILISQNATNCQMFDRICNSSQPLIPKN